MPRVKTGTTRKARHKKVLARTKGMRMSKGTLYKVSKEADLHAGQYAFIGRKLRKRDFRKLWIMRINAGLKTYMPEVKYSRLINMMKKANILVDRKIMSELAVSDPNAFSKVVEAAQKAK